MIVVNQLKDKERSDKVYGVTPSDQLEYRHSNGSCHAKGETEKNTKKKKRKESEEEVSAEK